MTLLEQEHETHSRESIAELVREVEAAQARKQAEYLATRHMVRVAAGIACAGVFLAGLLVALFSG